MALSIKKCFRVPKIFKKFNVFPNGIRIGMWLTDALIEP